MQAQGIELAIFRLHGAGSTPEPQRASRNQFYATCKLVELTELVASCELVVD